MTYRYRPLEAALVGYPWNITYLSQRDVELTIPIPYVNAPGISLSSACFPDNRYDDYSAVQCISNLLALGFRRFYLDLYWDTPRQTWSFCPVEIPLQSSGASHSSKHATSTHKVAAAKVSASTSRRVRILAERQQHASTVGVTRIQTAPTSKSISRSTLTVSISTGVSTTVAVIPTPHPSKKIGEDLYSIGPYVCSATSALHVFNSVLYDFMDATDNTLAASLRYVILNLHAAASAIDPLSDVPEPKFDSLAAGSPYLGSVFRSMFGEYLFTPKALRIERRNLKLSWYEASPRYRPQPAYYTRVIKQGVMKTPDGWPSESVLEFQSDTHRRLLLGFGSIDAIMRKYNTTRDKELIFAPGTLESEDRSCYFDPQELSLSSVNNSWAVSGISNSVASEIAQSSEKDFLTAVTSLVRCGTAPILKQTLSKGTAAAHVLPYKHIVYSSIWSWAPGQPQSKLDDRCAVMDPSSQGRWHVVDCSATYHAACRVDDRPYNWTISRGSGEYTEAKNLCPNDTAFSVPRTPLELRYLLERYRQQQSEDSTLAQRAELPRIWIDLNSLDIPDCWVSGATTSCPYHVTLDTAAQIYVPTIAGVVILIFAALLVLVKCGFNRRNSRRRRRGSGGWDYEGVPS